MLMNGVWSYTWNGENRLIKAENAASGMKLEFDYDYMGRRIYKKVYENNTLVKHLKFVYDGYKLIEEFDGLNGDALVRRYVWQSEDFGLDVPVSVYDAAGNKTYFYHTDANKNITELSDENGGIVAHYEYSPFGSLTASSGEYAEENPFRFSSEYSDMETGLVYYNYRYYSPELGRWLSRDPIEEQGGYNLYGMLGNIIISSRDILGLRQGKNPPIDCKRTLEQMKNLLKSIERRKRDLDTNPQNLPETCDGDMTKKSKSREGHRHLIKKDQEDYAKRYKQYLDHCGPPPGNFPSVVDVPAKYLPSLQDDNYKNAITGGLLIAGGISVIIGTVVEDFATYGIGIVNDGPSIGIGVGMVYSGFRHF